jgi:uncharacterized integral membrane protein
MSQQSTTHSDGNQGASTTAPADIRRRSRQRPTRLSNLYVSLVTAAVMLILLVIFLFQNARSVDVHVLNGQLRMPLAVALLAAAVIGALLVGIVGLARISQLRRGIRRNARSDSSHP